MISRHFSERTARTSSGAKRPTVRRGIKKRGILPSFGDIILPVVSIAAVGLLILAGRQFFINGMKTPPGISSTRAYAEAPALIAERERRAEAEAELMTHTAQVQDVEATGTEINASDTNLLAVAEIQETSKPDTQTLAQTQEVKLKAEPAKISEPQVKKTEAKPEKKPEPVKKADNANNHNSEALVKRPAGTNLPPIKQWRVQIGAYTSKAGAQEAAKKIKKAGYKAVVYSNPASKHTKVWVLGGTDKRSAERIANAMKSIGYKSSFVFPPAK